MAKKEKFNYRALLSSGIAFVGAGVVFVASRANNIAGALMMLFGGGLMIYSRIKKNEEKGKKTYKPKSKRRKK